MITVEFVTMFQRNNNYTIENITTTITIQCVYDMHNVHTSLTHGVVA